MNRKKIIESSIRECSFCKTILMRNVIEHEKRCLMNPYWIQFAAQKNRIKLNPLPPTNVTHSICKICETNYPMYSSDICYECKDK